MISSRQKLFDHSSISINVLSPMVILTIISGILIVLLILQEKRSHNLIVEEKKNEYVNHMRTIYNEFKLELQSVAHLISNHSIIRNGLLIGSQFEVLNSISLFHGHSGIDLINVYDLEGRAFARAQSPSYFGDQDDFLNLANEMIVLYSNQDNIELKAGIIKYNQKFYVIVASVIESVSGPAGVVVVGSELNREYLSNLLPEWHSGIILSNDNSEILVSTIDNLELDSYHRILISREHDIYKSEYFNIDLLIEDKFFESYWKLPIGIIVIVILTSIGSVVFTFLFLYRRVISPVKHLIDIAEEQVTGNLSARVNLSYNDELGRLGQILNTLTENLKTTFYELESRVEERTEDLLAAKEYAENANKSKSRFLAAASHDLRQPVNAISFFTSDILANPNSPKLAELLENIDTCVNSLREMFDKIMDISRLESGLIEPQVEEFPLDRLFIQLLSEYASLAAIKGIKLKYIKTSLIIRSDPILVYRIISNLVSNAIRYTKQGRVLLGCRRCNNEAKIVVLDSGGGIAEENIDIIFEEYFRGKNQQSLDENVGVGLGLGLSIAEHTAKLLEHELKVKSEVNKYTMFSLVVPRIDRASTVFKNEFQSEQHYQAIDNLSILLVDDNAMSLKSMQSILNSWGCTVIVSDTYRSVFNTIKHLPYIPDLIITDYLLDEKTGLDLIINLQEFYKQKMPCIVISGVMSRILEKKVENMECYLLYKPIKVNILRAMIDRCCTQYMSKTITN